MRSFRLGSALALALALAFVNGCAALAAAPTEGRLLAPNVVPISPRLVTSGQPTAAALAQLGARGFGAVIYLAPPGMPDAVPDEAGIVRRQGLEYVDIPIRFGSPTDADVRSFIDAMNKFRDRKVLVHCQVNMRASSMTFLYRVLVDHDAPELAYASVTQVWSPEGPWKQLIVTQLRRANIDFEPY